MAIGVQLANREQHIQRAHHVVYLREHRVLPVDHRIRRGALLGKVNHRVGLEILEGSRKEVVIRHVHYKKLDRLARQVLPYAQAVRQRPDRCQRLRAKFVIPLAPQIIVHDRYRMPFLR